MTKKKNPEGFEDKKIIELEEQPEEENKIEENEQIEEVEIIDEAHVIQAIVVGSDWQEVLTTLVAEQGMDPLSVDIIKLADNFTEYLSKLNRFDFRVPARFILVAAILLRMKAELLLDEEEEKIIRKTESTPLNIENVPMLLAPMERKPTKKVTLTDLVNALNKAFDFQERKEGKKLRMRRSIEKLIVPEEDVEVRIKEIYEEIVRTKTIKFSELVPVWRKTDIVKTFLPVLHLANRSMILCEQEDMFKEIFIRLSDQDVKPETPSTA